MEWYTDLCEYYKVSPKEADDLGTRKKGRKPNLPGSATCEPVSGLTFEEIWKGKPRETTAQIFEFYKDIGSWSSFRQCKYHEHGTAYNTGPLALRQLSTNNFSKDIKVLEYGAGVSPVCCWLYDNAKNYNFDFFINDVPSEHLTFGEWRLRKRGAKVSKNEIKPDKFPNYGSIKFDFVFMLDVLEHLNDPFGAINEIIKHSAPNKTLFFETWVNHEEGKATNCDLDRDKAKTIKLIRQNFSLILDAGGMRIWRKLLLF